MDGCEENILGFVPPEADRVVALQRSYDRRHLALVSSGSWQVSPQVGAETGTKAEGISALLEALRDHAELSAGCNDIANAVADAKHPARATAVAKIPTALKKVWTYSLR